MKKVKSENVKRLLCLAGQKLFHFCRFNYFTFLCVPEIVFILRAVPLDVRKGYAFPIGR